MAGSLLDTSVWPPNEKRRQQMLGGVFMPGSMGEMAYWRIRTRMMGRSSTDPIFQE